MIHRAVPGDLPTGSWPWLHDLARWIGTWLWYPIFRLHLHGRDRAPRTGPVVLVANHSAFVDGPLLFGLLHRRPVFLVKQEMFAGPLGRPLRWIGQLSVRRGTPDRAPLMAALGILKAGGMIAVFPEGTREGGGEVEAAQHGAAWLARTSGAVIVPIVCRGTRRAAGTRRRFRPRVDVLVGEPIVIGDEKGRAGLTVATETIRATLAGMVRELDELRSRT